MVFVTAEIGINHNGDIAIAKQLIDTAVSAGCDAVKFQKRTIEKVYSKEILDSPRDSPWGTTQRDQKTALEFSMKDNQSKLTKKSPSNVLRLQKYIADCGFTSRRKAEELIKQGKVKVN